MNGKLVADKYRIDSLVRESESGDLYVGHHEVLDKPVTIRILSSAFAVDPRWVKRFVAEARAASALSHPNILNITDFGTDAKNVTYAVFEPADGKTLGEMTANEQPFDEKRALDITRQIASALAAAHSQKVVHAALEPRNIFVNKGDAVRVFGFGGDPMNVARDADPRYLAPEQCNAFPAADERSDVYSLGVILYEMLGGTVPYAGATAAEILAKQNSEPPPPLSAFRRDLHPEIEPIVLSAMALDPERRYPNMAAFAEDLEILASRLGGAGAEPVVAAAAAAGSKRSVWQTAFFVLAGVAIFAAALIYATSVRKTDPTANLVADAGSLPVQPIGPATGAQEESLAKLPTMTEAEIMATQSQMNDLPGGDGFNAWANGGIPPAGAPLAGSTTGIPSGIQTAPPMTYVPQGGDVYTIPQGGQSQFMPDFTPSGGVDIRCKDVQTGQEIPCPSGPPPTVKASPTPKTGAAANTAVPQPSPVTAATPKPMATPPPKGTKPATDQPDKGKPAAPATKPAKSGTQKISEELPGGE
ncbi:MAG TPA: protein kinase [Pyrinomonadaceae bacterium]|nr:protein kinase [Acidobacteriota bacterium]HQZ96389.1 protein kinase [Pyrinomonadaceae bacterium]